MYQKKNSNAQKQRLKRELKFKKYLTNFIWITVNQIYSRWLYFLMYYIQAISRHLIFARDI